MAWGEVNEGTNFPMTDPPNDLESAFAVELLKLDANDAVRLSAILRGLFAFCQNLNGRVGELEEQLRHQTLVATRSFPN